MTKSTIVLIFAVLGMFAVGAATLTFVIMLASDGEERERERSPRSRTRSRGSALADAGCGVVHMPDAGPDGSGTELRRAPRVGDRVRIVHLAAGKTGP